MLVFVLLATLGLASCRLMCGIEPVTTLWMEVFVKLDCPQILKQHQKCCTSHGWCFIYKKVSMESCNNEYCNCVGKLAKDGICKTHSDNFCMNVKNLGPSLWPMINENAMLV